ncbi:LytR/AlgR family response regulator transcription factor [Alloacidobacterium sp.]|uniref:LytR/AlgR family response regulator transcription factor n=1 Tax=Alloacidobacterium sp. TaxID=2951999 RepID=UPI002D6E3D7B|nr:response regulator [Alloacidobacterium sp.]HYK36353.1 response regulator [Alloacidobacterium sp.]
MSYRTIVIDDEPLARRGIISRLRPYPQFEVVGECGNGMDALVAIAEHHPNLIFLDVQMPEMDGFEMLENLPTDERPAVIFLTAFDQYALRAFDVHAADYLLKPIDDIRFAEAIDRVQRVMQMEKGTTLGDRLESLLSDLHARRPSGNAQRFAIRNGRRIFFVTTNEVEWIEAQGDYAALHVNGKTHLLREPLHILERRLDPSVFVRIHRSTIVRMDQISEMQALANRDCLIRLKDGTTLRVSRSYSERLQEALSGA